MIFIGYFCIFFSFIFIFSGLRGLFKFSNFFQKIHAASVIESCGAPLFLFGLSCLQTNYVNSFKLLLAAFLIFLLGPVSSHALGKAGLKLMHKLELSKKNE